MADEEMSAPRMPIGLVLCIAAFAVLYLLLFVLVLLDDPFDFTGTRIPGKLWLVAAPVYMWVFLNQRGRLVGIDCFAPFVPFGVWLVFVLFGFGKSGMNFFIVEPYVVGLLSGLYLLRFPLAKLLQPRFPVRLVAAAWLLCTTVVTETVALLIPVLPE